MTGETYGAISMFVNPVLTNHIKGFSFIRVIVFPGLWHPWDILHNYTSSWYLIKSFEPRVTAGQFCRCVAYLATSSPPWVLRDEQFLSSSQTSQLTNISLPRDPASRVRFCRCEFSSSGRRNQWNQWKDLKQVRNMCMWFNESAQKRWSHISTNSQRSWVSGASSMASAELNPNEAAQ